MKSCQICYEDKKNSKTHLPSCNCFICSECLTLWAVEKLSDPNCKDTIKCPGTKCDKAYSISEYNKMLNSQQIVQINDVLAKKYCQTTSDIRNCPNQKCKNYGFLNPKGCDELVKCSVCNTEWEDFSQYTYWKKTQIYCRDFFSKKNEISSSVFEELFTNLCPKCDVHIQKNGGCMHMTCSKCKYEFCWMCKQQWKNHSGASCGGNIFTYMITIISILSLFFNKLGVLVPVFCFIWWIAKYLFRQLIFNNLFFFWIGYFFTNINYYRNLRKSYYKPSISVYLPIIGAGILAILMFGWMLFQGTVSECLYFGAVEGMIAGGGFSIVFLGVNIWDNWLNLVY